MPRDPGGDELMGAISGGRTSMSQPRMELLNSGSTGSAGPSGCPVLGTPGSQPATSLWAPQAPGRLMDVGAGMAGSTCGCLPSGWDPLALSDSQLSLCPQACGEPTWNTPMTSTSRTWPPSTRWWTGSSPSSATCGRWTAAMLCTAGRRRASGSRVSGGTLGVPVPSRRMLTAPILPSSWHPAALHPRRLQVHHLPHALLQAGAEVGGAAAAERLPGHPQPRHGRWSLQGAAALLVGLLTVSPVPQPSQGCAWVGFEPTSLRAVA